MKTKLFLLVSCLIMTASLNAQTLDGLVVESSAEAISTASTQVYAVVRAMDEGGIALINVSLSQPINCEVIIKGFVELRHILEGPPFYGWGGSVHFVLRLEPGETFAYSRIAYDNPLAYFNENKGIYADELYPLHECEGNTVIFNIDAKH